MRRPAVPHLRKSSGAFDLPSIITGVVVVGILAAGVLAAIFGVIPYTQNNGAKQDLSAIRTAEGVARAKDNRFMDHAGLIDTGYLQLASTEKTKVMADEKGTCYVALAKSGTGKVFYSTDTLTDPELFTADTDPGCLPADKLAELIDSVGGIDTVKGAPANLTLKAVSALQAEANWDPVKGATGYKIEYRAGDGDWKVVREDWALNFYLNLKGLPQETVGVRVSAVKAGGEISDPATASVVLPDSAVKNPSFEEGSLHWTFTQSSYSSISSEKARTGIKSLKTRANFAKVEQKVAVTQDATVLTYWSTSDARVALDGSYSFRPVVKAAEDGVWTQYKVDLSPYVGRAITIAFVGWDSTVPTYIDDVSVEGAMVPSQPLTVGATSQLGKANITWANPSFSGGTAITSYRVTAFKDGAAQKDMVVSGSLRTAAVEGLDIGGTYTFTVDALNAVGASESSEMSQPIEITDGAFSNGSFEQGSSAWTLPNSGYSSITEEKAHTGTKSFRTTQSFARAEQRVTITKDRPILTAWSTAPIQLQINGQYPGAVPSIQENGWTLYKANLSSYVGTQTIKIYSLVSPTYIDDVDMVGVMAPSAPRDLTVSTKESNATVTWAAPSFSGGSAVTSYTATAYKDGREQGSVTVAGTAKTATISGLEVGSSYTFMVVADNAAGSSPRSAETTPVEITNGTIANPGFETGAAGWTHYGSQVVNDMAHSGVSSVKLPAYGNYIRQSVTVPGDKTVLTFWLSGSRMVIGVSGSNVSTFASVTEGAWTKYEVDLSSYAGRTVVVEFESSGGIKYLDDFAFQAKG